MFLFLVGAAVGVGVGAQPLEEHHLGVEDAVVQRSNVSLRPDLHGLQERAGYRNLLRHSNQASVTFERSIREMKDFLKFYNLDIGAGYLSRDCTTEVGIYAKGLRNQEKWALQLLDSNDLFPSSGILDLNVFHFPGSMDECLRDSANLTGRYWMLTTTGPQLNPVLGLGFTRVGRCFPSSCSEADVLLATNLYLDYVTNTTNIYHGHVLNEHVRNEKIDLTSADIVMIVVIALLGTIVVIATVIDVLVTVMEVTYFKTNMLFFWQGFSLYNNTVKLFNTDVNPNDSSNMSCLNGIRAISISWVVLGHTLFEWTIPGLVSKNGYMLKNLRELSDDDGPLSAVALTAVWNGLFSVDTFFLMGATLVAFHTLKEMDKNRNKPPGKWAMFWVVFYLHRYIRLTAVYSITLGLHTTLLKYLAYGPTSFLVTKQVENCQQSWWLNLLYINNFYKEVGKDAMCMGWTWYMALDMQFFIITPFLLYALWKNFRIGLAICTALLAATTATVFSLTWTDENQFFHGEFDFYIKPWNRFQPYVIGLVLGCILYRNRDVKKIKISLFTNMLLWIVSALLACSVIYGITKYNIVKDINVTIPNSPTAPSTPERAFFNGLAKLAWSFPLCWVILACVKGRGGVVNSFLSWGFWIPLARLSYCIYLVQYTVIFWFNSQLEHSVVYNNALFVYTAIGNFAMCCAVALVLVLLFEAPCLHLEKLAFGYAGIGRLPSARKGKDEKM